MPDLNFKPRARLMILLGDQLIRDAGIAVFELVKNAYDAGATTCSIQLEQVQHVTDKARIIVEDNGTGMDIRTIRKVWLSPGTRNRLTEREGLLQDSESSKNKELRRIPLGEKGVGRFAVHKLGDRVKMITRFKGKKEIVVVIDWSDFENDSPLSQIPVTVSQRKPQHFTGEKTGTRIEITDLRELPWRRRAVRSLHRAVTSISSPVAGPEAFTATLTLRPDPGKWLHGLLSPADIMKLALFRFRGVIDDGQLTYEYNFKPWPGMSRIDARQVKQRVLSVDLSEGRRSRSRNKEQDQDKEVPLDIAKQNIGPIEMDFYIFDRDRSVLQFVPGNIDLVKDFLDMNGGVRVYRDGMRVYDFGEAGNDWLDLGGRRVNVPSLRIGNNQIVGIVRLTLAKSRGLIEKTNREGFVENDAYRAFRAAVRFALTQAEAERNADKQRIRKVNAKQKKEPVLGELAELRDEIDKLQIAAEDNKRLKLYLDRIEVQFREILDRLLTAAGAGLNLAIVLHEVEKGIKALYHALANAENPESILDRAKQLADIVDSLTWLIRQSGVTEVEADALIRHCIFAWSYRFKNHDIVVTNGIEKGEASFKMRGNRRLLMTALMNLIDNAIYWVGTKNPSSRRIYIGTTTDLSGNPAFLVADSGPGIEDPPDYVTMPFFTRKPDGIGLGLHIADEIMKLHGGKVEFPEPGAVTVPKGHNGAVVLLQFGETQP